MYYISSKRGSMLGVTDTWTGETQFLSDENVVKLLQSKIYIYGTSLYNYKSNGSPLTLGEKISNSKFSKLIDSAKKLHNPWTMAPLADYLACVGIGSVIKVWDIDPRTFEISYSRFEKLDVDTWYLRDSDNTIADMPMHSHQIDEIVLHYCWGGNYKAYTEE